MHKYETVTEFMKSLDSDKRAQVELLRTIIGESHADLTEHIKWNAPSYVLDGEDRITFNLMNRDNLVKLIIHMGAMRKENKQGKPIMLDDGGIVHWSSDIRGTITFSNLEEITSKSKALKNILSRWLSIK